MKKNAYFGLLFCLSFLTGTAQQELLDGRWILDHMVIDDIEYTVPPPFSQSPGCLPLGYFPGISFWEDTTGNFNVDAVLTFNGYFNVDEVFIDSNSFTTTGGVTLGDCECICNLESLYLVTVLAGDYSVRTHMYDIVSDTTGDKILTITSPEGNTAVYNDWSLGLNDVETQQTVTLFPNPSSNELQISTENVKIQMLRVYSVLGNNVRSYKSVIPKSIDISGLQNGTYFVEITSSNGDRSIQRIIKK